MKAAFVFYFFLGLACFIDAQFGDISESNEIAENSEPDAPSPYYTSTLGNKGCHCGGGECKCCVTLHHIPFCVDLQASFKQKIIGITIEAKGKHLLHKSITMDHGEKKICQHLPFPMSFLKVCLIIDVNELSDNSGIKVCPKFELMKGHHKLGGFPFPCEHLKKGGEKLNLESLYSFHNDQGLDYEV